jgi:RNA-binding protein YlmH
MNDDIEIIKKRFAELAAKADNGAYFTFTDFLGLPEQSAFAEVKTKLPRCGYTVFGGAVGAERIVIRFGDPDQIGYEADFPISCVKIEPLAKKFADKLTHRDFLGALLNLGIERSTIGDIVISDNVGYVFALDNMAEFIKNELSRVKRTDVKAEIIDTLPDVELYKTEQKRIQLSGERLDAVIAKVYSLSREDAQNLFKKRLVYANGKLCESVSYTPKEGDKISVRGHGRFIYLGFDSLSRKGKLNAIVEVYV